jgi:hypothetical protein
VMQIRRIPAGISTRRSVHISDSRLIEGRRESEACISSFMFCCGIVSKASNPPNVMRVLAGMNSMGAVWTQRGAKW